MAIADSSSIALRDAKSIMRRAASNFSWSLVGSIGGKGLFFISMVLLARKLGVEHFGIFSFAHILTTYFWISVDLGLNMYGAREVAKQRGKETEILNTILSLRLVSGALVFLIFMLYTYSFLKSTELRIVYAGFSFYLIFRALYNEWFLRGIEKYNYIAAGNMATFGAFFLSVHFLVKDQGDLMASSFMWSFSFLLGDIILLFLTYRARPQLRLRFTFSPKLWLSHIKESIHFTLSGGLSTFYQQLPIILLGILSTNYDIGIYSAVHRIIFAIIFVLSIYPMAIYPILSDLHVRSRKSFFRLYKLSLLLTMIVTLLLSLSMFFFSSEFCTILLGEKYSGAGYIFRILVGFLFLRSIREVSIIALNSAGMQRFNVIAACFGVISTVTFFFVIRHAFGADYPMAASLSLLLTEIGLFFIVIHLTNKMRAAT